MPSPRGDRRTVFPSGCTVLRSHRRARRLQGVHVLPTLAVVRLLRYGRPGRHWRLSAALRVFSRVDLFRSAFETLLVASRLSPVFIQPHVRALRTFTAVAIYVIENRRPFLPFGCQRVGNGRRRYRVAVICKENIANVNSGRESFAGLLLPAASMAVRPHRHRSRCARPR